VLQRQSLGRHLPYGLRSLGVCALVAPLMGLVMGLGAGACSSPAPKSGGENGAGAPIGEVRDTSITHEDCPTAGKQVKTSKPQSAFASNKSYVSHVFDGSREVCSFADLDGDGIVDLWTFYGPDGKVRRREASYGVTKGIDEIAIYKDGELDLVLRETNFDGKIDTWDYYEGGKLARRERDKSGAGRVEEWWTFEPPGSDNATIVPADPRTGKPDPSQTIKLGAPVAPKASAPAVMTKPPATPPTPSSTASSTPAAPSSSAKKGP